MTTDSIISKVWSFCNTLRVDGVGYGVYLEQLTYLIFLKMADEYSHPPYKRNVGVPARFAWPARSFPFARTASLSPSMWTSRLHEPFHRRQRTDFATCASSASRSLGCPLVSGRR